jgi:hypothetical protein
MEIELRRLSTLRPYANNPRRNEAAIAVVAASIRQFGFRQPLVIDDEEVIIVGDTRYKAALQLGLECVPVHVARDLTDAQKKAYRLADNQTATLATWDDDRLAQEILALHQMDFDLSLTGFSAEELLRFVDPPVLEGLTDPDDVPQPPEKAQTQPGELILLGKHRLLCGDSSRTEDVDRLLDGAPVHLVNTDPPYNVKVEPRSNNAIAAGQSSFSKTKRTHHQAFDWRDRAPRKKRRPSCAPRASAPAQVRHEPLCTHTHGC